MDLTVDLSVDLSAPADLTDPPLPATVRLDPFRTVLAVDAATRLLGLDPASALLVEDLSPPLARLIDTLAEPAALLATAPGPVGHPTGPEPDPDAHPAHPPDTEPSAPVDGAALLHRLWRAGVLVDAEAARRRSRRLADAVVQVVGDGPLAMGVATGLAAAGVGAVHVEAGGIVQAGDLGTGHRDADRGRPRAPTIAAAVRRVAPATRTGPLPQRSQPELAVLTDALVPEPDRLASLLGQGIPHLVTHLRDGAGVVGPLVLPGRSPCLRCLELHRGATAPEWHRVAARLPGRTGRAAPASATATAALATAQALAVLDPGPTAPPALGATLVVDLATAAITRRGWPAHPRCPCRAVHCTDGTRPGTRRQGVTQRTPRA